MRQNSGPRDAALSIVVLVHVGISLIHGLAHTRANVLLPAASMLFVFVVILIGPVAGLVVLRWSRRAAGSWLIAVTMAGALAFGVWNHFLVESADHVSRVTGPWSGPFGVTAALLAVTELAGFALAVRSGWEARTAS